ncbi:MAG: nucleotidyltransferase domain-containing protein [Candidatus Pacearchaeota archaeon]
MKSSLIEELKKETDRLYLEILGYFPEKTSLEQIPENKWSKFAMQEGFNKNSFGVYLPRNQIAIVRDKNPLSLFHEYFGHGLYCEQSLVGRKIVDLERILLEEERREFKGKNFSLEDLKKFRERNKTFQELEKFKQENLGRYELFAIWTEYFLSDKFCFLDNFEKKYDFMSKKDRETLESLIIFSKRYGNLSTMYAQGMARRTTAERVKRLLEDIYKDKLKDVKFALLYGSKKEFSDIDIFIVGEEIPKISNEWIDVAIYNPLHFDYCVSMFDVAVTDPLFSGEVVISRSNWEIKDYREKLKSQAIAKEAVFYNLTKSKEQLLFSLYFPENSKERKIGLSYSQTYLANYLALKEGKRLFTKNELLSYLQKQAPAEGDKPLHLKGGKFK